MAIQGSGRLTRLALSSAAFLITVIFSFCSCGEKKDRSVSMANAGQPMDPALVKSKYDARCGICHGSDGKLMYAGSKDLSISVLSHAEVVAQVTYGKGTMPPMKNMLEPEEIEAIADYTMGLRGK